MVGGLQLDTRHVPRVEVAGSLTEQLGMALLPAAAAATMLRSFGVLATILAATGVYGIMAYSVSRRTREIGIRMALGASAIRCWPRCWGRTARLIAIAAVAGLGLALASGRLFSVIPHGVSASDPVTYALPATCAPRRRGLGRRLGSGSARRAIEVDPAIALRTECGKRVFPDSSDVSIALSIGAFR